jgi:lipopolysaccharide transport system permease protein
MVTDSTSNAAGAVAPRATRRTSVIRAPTLSARNLPGDLAKLAQYRDLLYTLTVHRIRVRYKQSILGIFWALLQPLSMMLIFTFVFSYIARVQSDGPYAIFAYTGLLPWTYFSSGLSNATNSLVSHSQFVTKVYFPREILPITYVAAALFDFLVASILLGVLMIYYHVPLTINVLYVFPIIVVITCFSVAMSFFFSATQVRFRDIGVAIPLMLQLWLFATPVIYPLNLVPQRLRPYYTLNPMVAVIDGFRQVTLRGLPPNLNSLLFSGIVSLILLLAGYLYFKRIEATMADVI